MATPNKTSATKKEGQQPGLDRQEEIKTDIPMSEKDEVKKAEERTKKGMKRK
jgi:hypothetical protein